MEHDEWRNEAQEARSVLLSRLSHRLQHRQDSSGVLDTSRKGQPTFKDHVQGRKEVRANAVTARAVAPFFVGQVRSLLQQRLVQRVTRETERLPLSVDGATRFRRSLRAPSPCFRHAHSKEKALSMLSPTMILVPPGRQAHL